MASHIYRKDPPILSNRTHPGVPQFANTPSQWAIETLHFHPDARQAEILDTPASRVLLCCSRQWGKSTITAIRALHFALHHPNSTLICVSPAKRQSAIFLDKIRRFLHTLAITPRTDRREPLSLLLPNGSSLIGLPAMKATTRGFSAVDFLILDEAARIPDSAYHAVRPFLATTNGLLWVLSTPHGESGFFYDEWHKHAQHWTRLSVPATDCPRISKEFLAAERRSFGANNFAQEYLCHFLPSRHQLIPRALIDRCAAPPPPPPPPRFGHFLPPPSTSLFHLGLDLGLHRNPTALSVLEEITRPTGEFDHVNLVYKMETVLILKDVRTFPLETPYAEITWQLDRYLTQLPQDAKKRLAVDATGAGDPVVTLFRDAGLPVTLQPIVITCGQSVGKLPHATSIPRKVLLQNLRIQLECKSFQIPPDLENLSSLTDELTALGARQNHPDDQAFSLALALWSARPNPNAGERSDPLPTYPKPRHR